MIFNGGQMMKVTATTISPLAGSQSSLLLLVALGALGVSGCSTTDPDTIERDFGNSVRRMVDAQKYAPDSTSYRSASMDGAKAQEVLAAYRRDVANPQKTERPIQIDVRD